MQWNNMKKRVLDTANDLIGKVDKTARKPGLQRKLPIKWMNEVEECQQRRKKNYRTLRNEITTNYRQGQ